ncbi:MAG TPA: NAD(P)-dependent alcohol dehydrogenase [Anaerolineales bacterium]|nr:NAD(P)-dependent alcohol dehydrogenase [Anaerolineales bacterium]
MKAIVYTQYGPPDVLHLSEVGKPVPNDNQVLVQVHAVSLNPAEAHMMSGILMARILGQNGILKPKNTIPGADFSGRVEAVGRNVTQFQPGDEVFGRRGFDGFAEYVCVTENPIALKPANMTFEQAAAVPVAGVTALQSLRDDGQIQPGQQVLINGASGGVGTFSVQIAKAFGARVTGVCSTRNLDLVRSLGADRVIDYTREDFTRNRRRYDLIIDNVGNHPVSDYVRALNPKGICVVVGYTSIGLLLQYMLLGRLISRIGSKKIGSMLAHIKQKDLVVLKELMEAGKIVPVVDKCYPLSQVPEAYRYLKTRHAPGKIVVTLKNNNDKAQ